MKFNIGDRVRVKSLNSTISQHGHDIGVVGTVVSSERGECQVESDRTRYTWTVATRDLEAFEGAKEYICPEELYGGSVPKGTIFEQTSDTRYYHPKGTLKSIYRMPKEIVEKWEANISKEKTFDIKGVRIVAKKGSFNANSSGVDFTLKQLKALIKKMNYSGEADYWTISFPKVQIGCTLFTLADLIKIETEIEKIK